MSGVTFGDSAFLNLLLRVHRTTELRIAMPQPQLRWLFEITGADKVLDVRLSLGRGVGHSSGTCRWDRQ
ncbi:STAS domain-containing protein [Streptomyces sp. NPDC001970]